MFQRPFLPCRRLQGEGDGQRNGFVSGPCTAPWRKTEAVLDDAEDNFHLHPAPGEFLTTIKLKNHGIF
jgi:hypothetical protein